MQLADNLHALKLPRVMRAFIVDYCRFTFQRHAGGVVHDHHTSNTVFPCTILRCIDQLNAREDP